jgi:hypothetical protein
LQWYQLQPIFSKKNQSVLAASFGAIRNPI